MYRFVLVNTLCACAALSSFGAAVDPSDAVLVAYKLTAAQKSQFSASDGKISPFWAADWSQRDYIDMNTQSNSYPGYDSWTGPDDAHFTMRAAASDAGLYFQMEVQDNLWVDPVSGGDSWQYDACDLYLDSKSSEAIKALGDAGMVNPAYGWSLTFTTQQIQVFMGSSALPTSFMYNYYDETFWDWTYNTVEFATAASTYNGMAMEVVKVDDTHKSQEWFIPWSQVGVGGVSGDLPAGKRFGFSGGYNDLDGQGGTVKQMRWKLYDPFASGSNGLNSWGDLELEQTVAAAVSPRARREARPGSASAAWRSPADAFGLRGERLEARAGRAAACIWISTTKAVRIGGLDISTR